MTFPRAYSMLIRSRENAGLESGLRVPATREIATIGTFQRNGPLTTRRSLSLNVYSVVINSQIGNTAAPKKISAATGNIIVPAEAATNAPKVPAPIEKARTRASQKSTLDLYFSTGTMRSA